MRSNVPEKTIQQKQFRHQHNYSENDFLLKKQQNLYSSQKIEDLTKDFK